MHWKTALQHGSGALSHVGGKLSGTDYVEPVCITFPCSGRLHCPDDFKRSFSPSTSGGGDEYHLAINRFVYAFYWLDRLVVLRP